MSDDQQQRLDVDSVITFTCIDVEDTDPEDEMTWLLNVFYKNRVTHPTSMGQRVSIYLNDRHILKKNFISELCEHQTRSVDSSPQMITSSIIIEVIMSCQQLQSRDLRS